MHSGPALERLLHSLIELANNKLGHRGNDSKISPYAARAGCRQSSCEPLCQRRAAKLTIARSDSLRTALDFGVALYQGMLPWLSTSTTGAGGPPQFPDRPSLHAASFTPERFQAAPESQARTAAFAQSCGARLARSLRGPFSTRQSSLSLRPAASLLLASTPRSRRTPEVDYRAPLVACPGGTHTRWSIGPSSGHTKTIGHLLSRRAPRDGQQGPRRWPGTSRALPGDHRRWRRGEVVAGFNRPAAWIPSDAQVLGGLRASWYAKLACSRNFPS